MNSITDFTGQVLALGDTVVTEAVKNMKLTEPDDTKLTVGVVCGLGWEEESYISYPQGTIDENGRWWKDAPRETVTRAVPMVRIKAATADQFSQEDILEMVSMNGSTVRTLTAHSPADLPRDGFGKFLVKVASLS